MAPESNREQGVARETQHTAQNALEPMPWKIVGESGRHGAAQEGCKGRLVLKPGGASAAGGRFDRVLPYFVQQGLVADFQPFGGLLAMPVCFL